MDKWEYKAVWYDGPTDWHKRDGVDVGSVQKSRKNFNDFINQYGQEGWYLVSDTMRCMIFARKV